MFPPSHWLTGPRLQRAGDILTTIPGDAPGIPVDHAPRQLWERCGGPLDETPDLIAFLDDLGLVRVRSHCWVRSTSGNRITRSIRIGDMSPLGLVILRKSCFHDQVRLLIESSETAGDGAMTCATKIARNSTPQLLGMLRWWADVQVLPEVVIPPELAGELRAIWSIIPPSPIPSDQLSDRKKLGDRAELYSVQHERAKLANPEAIIWASRDSEALGWDVEDRSGDQPRYIEVKGRRDKVVAFFLSENEYAKAHEHGPRYEIQFWGRIDISRDPAEEYADLISSGYPLIFEDLASRLSSPELEVHPVRWRVQATEAGETGQ